MRRRRRAGGAWLPVNPTFFSDPTEGYSWYQDNIVGPANPEVGGGFLGVIPLTTDNTQNAILNPDASFRDQVEGQDYTLNRIVGKVWAGVINDSQSAVGNLIVCFAVAVLPTAPDSNVPSIPLQNCDPLLAENSQEPWVWRRTWILTNGNNEDVGLAFPFYAGNTAAYGSVLDGGHIDSKMKRRITREHRLYICIAGRYTEVSNDSERAEPLGITFGFDVRLNGAMRKARNRSSF